MSLKPEEIAIIGALGGVLITSLFNLANNWITKRSDERSQLRELVVNAAIENWKEKTALTMKLEEMNPGSMTPIYPLDFFIVYMAKICDVALKPHVSRDEIASKFREARETMEELTAENIREQEDRALRHRQS
jgi:uncharacterized membrane protein YbaN (DUF454 family)